MFAPALVGRLRTVAAWGVDDLAPRFEAFNHLFAFLHLEPAFALKAWVVADGDEAGKSAIASLVARFESWRPEHFANFSEPAFENYYPTSFKERAAGVLQLTRDKRRAAKKALLDDVLVYLREDRERARRELSECAAEVVAFIRRIDIAMS